MFSGGDYAEVGRWLANFVTAHAKRARLEVEAVVDAEGGREGKSYGVRLRLGQRLQPTAAEPPLELDYAEVAARRGSLAWCEELAGRVKGLARRFADADQGSRQPA